MDIPGAFILTRFKLKVPGILQRAMCSSVFILEFCMLFSARHPVHGVNYV